MLACEYPAAEKEEFFFSDTIVMEEGGNEPLKLRLQRFHDAELKAERIEKEIMQLIIDHTPTVPVDTSAVDDNTRRDSNCEHDIDYSG